MREGVRRSLWAALVMVGLLLLLWKWEIRLHWPVVDVVIGLLVILGVPTIIWLSPRLPRTASSKRLPAVFWIGLGMLTASLLLVDGVSVPNTRVSGGLGIGVRVSAGSGPSIVKGIPPLQAKEAVARVLPKARIAEAFTSVAPGSSWILLLAEGNRLMAEARWDGRNLTLNNLGSNTYFTGDRLPKQVYSWEQLKRVVQIPSGSTVWGPYRLPGYDIEVVPDIGQIWDLNVVTGNASGRTV